MMNHHTTASLKAYFSHLCRVTYKYSLLQLDFAFNTKTSLEQKPSKSASQIFLKYGRILETKTSPFLKTATLPVEGIELAFEIPALFGNMFSVET